MKDFKTIIESIGKDVLTEEAKSSIIEAFDKAVSEKVESRVNLEVETAIKKLDEDHGQKLDELLEAIDADHTNKFKKVLIKVDEEYAEKLQKVVNKYETMIKEEAIQFREQLTSELSNFMDLYLKEMIPHEQLELAVENTRAKKIVESMKKLVSVDESFITDNIREALKDGKDQIESLREELHESMKANIQINQQLKKTTAEKMLIEKTMNFDQPKKNYVMRVLSEKSPEEIEQNFKYVVEMAERDESSEKELIKEQAKKKAKSVEVNVPKAEVKNVIEESVTDEDSVDSYLTELKNL